MAAYGTLVSVMHIVEQIQNHLRPPISLDKKLAQSLTDNITFLQDYLENYSFLDSEEAHALESHIADVAYVAEDVIESHIANTIEAHWENTSSTAELYGGLQKVIREMESIKNEVTRIKEKMTVKMDQRVPRVGSSSSGSNSTTVVGFDEVLIEVMDKLTGQQSAAGLQIIPIVGMGGIGKTTLARSIYVNPLIVQYFDSFGWATISQEFNSKEIILEILACLKGTRESLSQMSEDELGLELYQSLFGRRYIIVLDDIWSIEAWDKVKTFFPNNNSDGSAIILTTRLSNLAFHFTGSDDFLKMSFLDEDKSWDLFCKCAFGKEDCPIGLEEMGMKISKACKGLPLSITVMGGLLARHKQSRRYWEYILENLNSILNSEDNEHCLRILRMSYKELPVHLKPCFLYMGAFPEDSMIDVSNLIRLWVAEGFLKPISVKSLETAAEEYLRDLVDRNLVLVDEWGHTGEMEYCKIHDLLRDLCLKEASKDKFLCFKKAHELIRSPHEIQGQRRIGFQGSVSVDEDYGAFSQSDLLRSVLCDFGNGPRYLPFLDSRLLRVLRSPDNNLHDDKNYSTQHIFRSANLRYLEFSFNQILEIPSWVHHFWSLQTIHVSEGYGDVIAAPVEIWKMPQLRHVMVSKLELPDPPTDDQPGLVVLGNLQTLKLVKNFNCGEDVLKRIPNVKKLNIEYEDAGAYSLDNLCRLSKLESLSCDFISLSDEGRSCVLQYLDFPPSLKELSLNGTWLPWEDVMMTKIGSLPCLQVLKLGTDSFVGPEWETVQGQFGSLKYLRIDGSYSLEDWRAESSHFPCLEHLVLRYAHRLKEIPSEIGDIPTLKTVQLDYCLDSAVISAQRIREEQEELGNVGLQVVVRGH